MGIFDDRIEIAGKGYDIPTIIVGVDCVFDDEDTMAAREIYAIDKEKKNEKDRKWRKFRKQKKSLRFRYKRQVN